MSQMGKVIKAVRCLFHQRDEQLMAIAQDETLFRAAQIFNQAIDDFERRELIKREGNRKIEGEFLVQLIEQVELKIADVVKVSSPQPISTHPPKQTVNTSAKPSGKVKSGAKTVPMLARELHMSIKGTLLLLSDLGIDKCAKGYVLSADQTAKVYDYILKNAGNEKHTQNFTPPSTAPKIKQKPKPKFVKKKSTLTKGQQNKSVKKVAATTWNMGARRSGTKCIKCGEAFSYAHKCPTTARKGTYTYAKPPAPVKRKAGEQDVIKTKRKTLFDKSTKNTAGNTPTHSTKYSTGNVHPDRAVIKKAGESKERNKVRKR